MSCLDHGIIAAPKMFPSPSKSIESQVQFSLLKSNTSKGWQNKTGLVDLGIVVSAKLVLLLRGPLAQRLADVAVGILRADHEADLAGWVGGDGGVCVFDGGEDLLAVLLQLGDQWEVEPLVLSYASN
jgi:hypothetical protein